ncbi:MAG: TlpA disulfide reductase family protein [Opitutaceae bacterium]
MNHTLKIATVALLTALRLGAESTPVATPAASAPAAATPAVPGIDPVATQVWQEHIQGMGDRGEGGRNVNYAQISGKALEFFERFPNERRVGGILFNLSSFGDWVKGEQAAAIRAGWQQHLRTTLADTLATKSWPDNVWAGLHWVAAKNELAIQMDTAGRPDLAVLKARIATVAARTPAAPYRTFLEQEYLKGLEKYAPAELVPYLTVLSSSDVADLAALGRGQLAIQALRTTPMELKFTALDGRTVDLASLRGQVVLIDCWATWCVPCVKELPNIKAALAKWGAKGFTVVGISFDRVGDKDKLVKFVADEQLVWPHWFNEAGGSNPFGKTYNIRSIPATFLLDRTGRLVTTETHGEKLDAALTRLLSTETSQHPAAPPTAGQ